MAPDRARRMPNAGDDDPRCRPRQRDRVLAGEHTVTARSRPTTRKHSSSKKEDID